MKSKYLKWAIIALAIMLIDLLVYVTLGIALMKYDDFYEPSKGAYFSWESMDSFDKKVYASLIVWNFLNLVGIIYLGLKIYQFFKHRKVSTHCIEFDSNI